MKVYISGKISGIEREARKEFAKAELLLALNGYEPINPFNLDHDHDNSWEEYMKVDIEAMLKCQAICMLKGWQESEGAKIEHTLASSLGFRVGTIEDFGNN